MPKEASQICIVVWGFLTFEIDLGTEPPGRSSTSSPAGVIWYSLPWIQLTLEGGPFFLCLFLRVIQVIRKLLTS